VRAPRRGRAVEVAPRDARPRAPGELRRAALDSIVLFVSLTVPTLRMAPPSGSPRPLGSVTRATSFRCAKSTTAKP